MRSIRIRLQMTAFVYVVAVLVAFAAMHLHA
jgi:hypothetical protein